MLKDLILKCRSYRRFHEDRAVDTAILRELVDVARLAPSGANFQPLKYVIANDPATNAAVFPHLAWAGYLKDWPGPAEGERPAAYIVIVCDTEVRPNPGIDHGIAAQNIVLAATEKGLGACMIGSIERYELAQALKLDDRYEIALVVALGYPKEQVVLETVGEDGSIEYWRDEQDVHHVPKRPLDDVILG